MKKLKTFIIVLLIALGSCTGEDYQCGSYNGNTLWTGPKGGCYYKNSGTTGKTYVDRSYCKC